MRIRFLKWCLITALALSTFGVLPAAGMAADSPAAGYEQIAEGYDFVTALEKNGDVWAWGNNSNYQLGDNRTTSSQLAKKVAGLSGVTAIANGVSFAVALDGTGKVWNWGLINHASIPLPAEVPFGSTGVKAIAAGSYFAYALTVTGNVYSWGASSYALGNGETGLTTPSLVVDQDGIPLSNIKLIAAGRDHGVAVDNNNVVYTWGDNSYGQLGTPVAATQNSVKAIKVLNPIPGDPVPDITDVFTSNTMNSTFIQTSTGDIYGWGDSWELGQNTDSELAPMRLLQGYKVKDIKVYRGDPFVLLDSGALIKGSNDQWELAGLADSNYAKPHSLSVSEDRIHMVGLDGSAKGLGANAFNSNENYGLVSPNGFHDGYYNKFVDLPRLTAAPDTSLKNFDHVKVSINGSGAAFEFSYPFFTAITGIDFRIIDSSGADTLTPLHVDVMSPSANLSWETMNGYLRPGVYRAEIKVTDPSDPIGKTQTFDNLVVGEASLQIHAVVPTAAGNVPVPNALFTFHSDTDIPVTTRIDGAATISGISAGSFSFDVNDSVYSPYRSYYDSVQLLEGSNDITVVLGKKSEPSYLRFADEDDQPGKIGGYVYFEGPVDESTQGITEYRLYMEDAHGNRISDSNGPILLGTQNANGNGQNYSIFVPYTELTHGSSVGTTLRIYKVIAGTEVPSEGVIAIHDYQGNLQSNAYVVDANATPDIQSPTVHWTGLHDESGISAYVVLNRESAEPMLLSESFTQTASSALPSVVGIRNVGDYSNTSTHEYAFTIADQRISNSNKTAVPRLELGMLNMSGELLPETIPLMYPDNRLGSPFATSTLDMYEENLSSPYATALYRTDWNAGEIGGVLSWQDNNDTFRHMGDEVVFMDEQNRVLGSVGRVYKQNAGVWGDRTLTKAAKETAPVMTASAVPSAPSDSPYYRELYIPDHTSLPAGTAKLGIFAFDNEGNFSKPAIVPLEQLPMFNSLAVSPGSITFIPNQHEYYVSVTSEVYSAQVTAAVADPLTMGWELYSEDGSAVQIAPNTFNVALNSNMTAVTAVVYNSGGHSSQSYSIIFDKFPEPHIVDVNPYVGKLDGTANKLTNVTSDTTVGLLLSATTFSEGADVSVVDATNNPVNHSLKVKDTYKIVVSRAGRTSQSYSIETIGGMLKQRFSGSRMSVREAVLGSVFKLDVFNDGIFNAVDLAMFLREIEPIYVTPGP